MAVTNENKKLLFLLHELSNNDLKNLRLRGARDQIYIMCANDLNYSISKEISSSEEENLKLIRYYGDAKQLHENYISLIICSLLSLDTKGTFTGKYVFYTENLFPGSIIQKLRTELKMNSKLHVTQLSI